MKRFSPRHNQSVKATAVPVFVLKVFPPVTTATMSHHREIVFPSIPQLRHLLWLLRSPWLKLPHMCRQAWKTPLFCCTPCWPWAWCCCFLACPLPWLSFWGWPGPKHPTQEPRGLITTRSLRSSMARKLASQGRAPKVSVAWMWVKGHNQRNMCSTVPFHTELSRFSKSGNYYLLF